MYVSAKPGTFGRGGGKRAAISRYRLRSLIGLLHIYLGSHPSSLEDFPPRGAWRVLQSIRCRDWESVGAGSSALLLCGFLCMVGSKWGVSRMIWGGGKLRGGEGGGGGQAPLHFFLRLFCACMYGWLKWGVTRDGEGCRFQLYMESYWSEVSYAAESMAAV